MEVEVNAKKLGNAVTKAARATPKRAIIPEHAFVKIDAEPGILKVTGTDGNLFITSKLVAQIKKPGSVIVVPKDITKTTDHADDNDIASLRSTEHNLIINCRGRIQAPIGDINRYPASPEMGTWVIAAITKSDIAALEISGDVSSILEYNSNAFITTEDNITSIITMSGAKSWFTIISRQRIADVNASIRLEYLRNASKAISIAHLTIDRNMCQIKDEYNSAIFPTTNAEPYNLRARFEAFPVTATAEPVYEQIIEAVEKGMYYTGPEGALRISGKGDIITISNINGTAFSFSVEAKITERFSTSVNANTLFGALKGIGKGAFIRFRQATQQHQIVNVGLAHIQHYIMPVNIKGDTHG